MEGSVLSRRQVCSLSLIHIYLLYPTGGTGFTKDEIIVLCKAKAKNKYGDNIVPEINDEQLQQINVHKQNGYTGSFKLFFSIEDDIKAEIIVTLTGKHEVSCLLYTSA